MRCVRDDRSEVGQSVHGRDVDSGFRRDVPKGTDIRGQRIWLDCAEVTMVDIRPVRRRRRERAAVQRGVGLRNNRPLFEWGAASAAGDGKSSSLKAALRSSRSNATAAANRSYALISKTISIS